MTGEYEHPMRRDIRRQAEIRERLPILRQEIAAIQDVLEVEARVLGTSWQTAVIDQLGRIIEFISLLEERR